MCQIEELDRILFTCKNFKVTIGTGVGGCVNPASLSPTATQVYKGLANTISPTATQGPSTTFVLQGTIRSCWNPAAATLVTCCTSSSTFSSKAQLFL